MAKCDSYKGSVEVVSGLVPKNGKDFPLLDAHYILIGDGDKRLDEFLNDFFDLGSLNVEFSVVDGVLKISQEKFTPTNFSVDGRVLQVSQGSKPKDSFTVEGDTLEVVSTDISVDGKDLEIESQV